MNPNDNPMNDNPIFGIIERGNLQQVKELFGKTYNLNTLNGVDADTIIFASQKGQLEIVKYLIDKIDEAERDYRIDYRDCDGLSALQWAAYNGHSKIVKLLIKNGADVNNKANDGRTPLIEATQMGHHETVKLLLENGANINAEDNTGWDSLMWARCEGCAIKNRNEMIEMLEETKEKIRRLR